MELFSSKKDKNNEIEDTIKILSTNLEVLNQKLVTSSSGSYDGLPKLEKQFQVLSQKIDYNTSFLKNLQENLQQHFSNNDGKFNIIDKNIKIVQSEVKNHLDSKQDELKRDINQGLINLLSNIGEEFKNNNMNLINLFNHFNQFKETFPQKFTALDEKLKKIDNNLNQNFKNIYSSKSNSSSQVNLSPDLIKDIKVIRNELEEKFQELTTQLYPLIKINKELIEILKDGKYQIKPYNP